MPQTGTRRCGRRGYGATRSRSGGFMKTRRWLRSTNWNPFWTKAGRWRTGTREFLRTLPGSSWKNWCSPQILPKSWKSYWIVCRATKSWPPERLGLFKLWMDEDLALEALPAATLLIHDRDRRAYNIGRGVYALREVFLRFNP